MRRLVVLATAIIALVLIAASCFAAGEYCLAFWREWGYYEKGGTGGAHVINVYVWDENGNPLSGKQITTNSGTPLGATDARGQVEIDIWATSDYDFKVNDGGIPSDVTPVFTTRRMPDWGHYSWECGFLYKSDVTNPGTFDLDIIGTLNSTTTDAPCPSPVMSAPRTESVAFYSCRSDPGYYCTDPQSPGGAAPTLGQTFKASGNRVVACKVHVLGGYGVQYIARIRQGGPTGSYVGTAATSPVTGEYEYAKTLTKWPIDGVTVVPGSTYYLEITKSGGGNIQSYRVTNNSYLDGCYYENGIQVSQAELKGHIVCATVGGTNGTISGIVRDADTTDPLVGALVETSPGGYSDTTGPGGTYGINLPADTYSVSASKSGYQTDTQYNKVVTPGGTTTVNFNLAPVAGGTIAGTVKNTSAVGIAGATVITDPGGYFDTTSGDGTYSIDGVPAGTYDVTASAPSYSPSTSYGEVVSEGATTTVNFTLVVSGPFSGIDNGDFEGGSYNDPDGDHSVANSWTKFILLSSNPKYSVPWLTTWHSGHYGQIFYESSWTAGIYQQATNAQFGNNYTAGVWVKGTDSSVQFWVGIDPTGGTNAASGNVQWSSPITPGDSWTQISKQVAASAPTITMFIKAQNVVPANRYAYIDDATLVDDGPTTGTISGSVKDNSGAGISGATVSTNTGGYSNTTGPGGDYTLANVAPATYNVTASKSGWQSQTQYNKQVIAGSTTTVNFNLTDASPPTTPVVTDDGVYTTSATQLHASWSASDPETGISEYQYAIGTSVGATDVVPWTSTGTSTEVTKTGLSLNYTSTYYFTVRAANADDMWSSSGASDGIRPARTVSDIADAKSYADNECVRVTGRVVSAEFADSFYIEDPDRIAGIKATGATPSEGTTVTVTGVIATTNGERVLTNAQVE